MIGMHKRLRDEVRQNKVVTLEMVHKLMEGLEEEYLEAGTDEERRDLADNFPF